MKIAIFHDYFGAIGGGERVVLLMARILDADIITTDTDALKKLDPHIRVISLGPTPKFRGYKQVAAFLRFYLCDFSHDYDLFIFSGNWAHYAAHRHHPNIWYCHTPVRAFYDLYQVFLQRLDIISRQEFRLWSQVQRKLDQRSVQDIDIIVANSKNVQGRIKRIYNRDSNVIYPPVNTSRFYNSGSGDFWFSVNRIYPEKRIELQIEAFRNLPEEKLVIAGGYAAGDHASGYLKKLLLQLPANVTMAGEVTEEKLLNLYANCKGFVCTAMDEDFGLTPLEAMASGKPVVAVDEGGFRETVTSQTGILVSAANGSIVDAIRKVSRDPTSFKEACIARAAQFDLPMFRERIITTVQSVYFAYKQDHPD